MMLITGAVFFV